MAKQVFFLKRLNEHVQYLKNMDSCLKGNEDFEGTSHTNCQLGQWLYGEAKAEIEELGNSKATELYESLLKPHERFHILGKEALEKKKSGDEAGAQVLLTELHQLSTTLTNTLLELDNVA